ncbi:MAG: nitroreductase family protein [Actinomycetota bacterium]
MSTNSKSEIGLLDGIATTRAIRRYTSDDIPLEDVNTILWHASRAPSGSNRQGFRFVVLRSSETAVRAKELIGEAFRAGWKAKASTDGYASGSGVIEDSPKSRQARAMQHYVDHFEDAPVVVLVCLVRHRAPDPYEGASVYPACQNLLLAARALGYGGVLTMWHHAVESELKELLEIPDEVALSACITLGRPVGSHGPVRRRPISELVYEDTWGSEPPWASDPPGTAFTSAGPRKS